MASRTQSTVSSALSWKPPPSRCVSACRQRHTQRKCATAQCCETLWVQSPEPDGTTHIVTMEHYLHALKNTTITDKMNQSTLNILLLWSDRTTLLDGANALQTFVARSPITWNMMVPTFAYGSCQQLMNKENHTTGKIIPEFPCGCRTAHLGA